MFSLSDDIYYVVRFENGKYFGGGFSANSETGELRYASKYTFDWQVPKDLYLTTYLDGKNLRYELIKVKVNYEIVD